MDLSIQALIETLDFEHKFRVKIINQLMQVVYLTWCQQDLPPGQQGLTSAVRIALITCLL